MYEGLSGSICETAWDMVLPAVERAAANGITDGHRGTIVVLDPTVPYASGVAVPVIYRSDILDGHTPLYSEFATAKAAISWRTGLSSREVQQTSPHLYRRGDIKWGGSVFRDGLIVAFSGVQAVLDEMIAGWMADALLGLCREAMTSPVGVMASGDSYLHAGQGATRRSADDTRGEHS
jgi:hypothetical protein